MKRLKILIIFQYLHRDSPIFFMILSSKSKIKNHSFFGVYLLRGERSEVLNLEWEVRQVRQWIIQGIRNGC